MSKTVNCTISAPLGEPIVNCTDPNFPPLGGPWRYGNWCGKGGTSEPINDLDMACMRHDMCYLRNGATLSDVQNPKFGTLSSYKQAALQFCNQQLCDTVLNVMPYIPWWNAREAWAAVEIYSMFRLKVSQGAECN